MKQNKLSNEELRDLMDEEARAAEEAAYDDEDDGAPLPPDVKVSRPNRARSKVLQVRLNPDEMEAVERIAARRELPPSTVAREWLLRMVAEDKAAGEPGETVEDLLNHLESTVIALRRVRAHVGVPTMEARTFPSSSLAGPS